MNYFQALIGLLTGMGVFLLGMHMMGEGLEKVASKKMRNIFSKLSNNRIVGVGVGAGLTAVIHSSAATTVMVIGFVNAGLMTLIQAANVIMGANIGTTITGLITALGSMDMDVYMMFPVFIGVVLMLFPKKAIIKTIGYILTGLGLIFVGLNLMTMHVEGISNSPAFIKIFTTIDNPFLLMLIGILITAIVQSSTAVNGLIIILAVPFGTSGGLDIVDAVFIILGTNVGTCVTALISSIDTNINAKRTSIFHLFFNVIGTVLFAIVFLSIEPQKIADMMVTLFGTNPAFQVAWFNFWQNLICALVMLPFTKQIVAFINFIVRDKKEKATVYNFKYIDERYLKTTTIAIGQVIQEIGDMNQQVQENFTLSLIDFIKKEASNTELILANQLKVTKLAEGITNYLIKISSESLSESDKTLVASLYVVVSNCIRLNDYGEDILNYNLKMVNHNQFFTDSAYDELAKMLDLVNELNTIINEAFLNNDNSKFKKIQLIEHQIENMKIELNDLHVMRLNEGKCSVENGVIYYGVVSILDRYCHHLITIANTLKSKKRKR